MAFEKSPLAFPVGVMTAPILFKLSQLVADVPVSSLKEAMIAINELIVASASLALERQSCEKKFGIAIELIMLIMATTITVSMSVNPVWHLHSESWTGARVILLLCLLFLCFLGISILGDRVLQAGPRRWPC